MNDARYVLDASALLATMLGEPGGDRVGDCLPEACISAVNFAEVVAKLVERGAQESEIAESLVELGIHVTPFDAEQATRTGLLRTLTRAYGLSLGDRACLTLASMLGDSVDGGRGVVSH